VPDDNLTLRYGVSESSSMVRLSEDLLLRFEFVDDFVDTKDIPGILLRHLSPSASLATRPAKKSPRAVSKSPCHRLLLHLGLFKQVANLFICRLRELFVPKTDCEEWLWRRNTNYFIRLHL
jgi:hypothetical protein